MNTTETKINIRVDKKMKEQAKKTLEALGLDLSSGVKLFLKSVINTQSIPFEIRTQNGYTTEQEQQILKETGEALADIKSGKTQMHSSAKSLIQSLIE